MKPFFFLCLAVALCICLDASAAHQGKNGHGHWLKNGTQLHSPRPRNGTLNGTRPGPHRGDDRPPNSTRPDFNDTHHDEFNGTHPEPSHNGAHPDFNGTHHEGDDGHRQHGRGSHDGRSLLHRTSPHPRNGTSDDHLRRNGTSPHPRRNGTSPHSPHNGTHCGDDRRPETPRVPLNGTNKVSGRKTAAGDHH
eukprot:scaffold2.g7249.t1